MNKNRLAVIALSLIATACGPSQAEIQTQVAESVSATQTAAVTPTSTVTPTLIASATPEFTETPTVSPTGYLWLDSDPQAYIPIIGLEHDSAPIDDEQLWSWAQAGEACIVGPGARYILIEQLSSKRSIIELRDSGVSEFLCGRSAYRGWTATKLLHVSPP